VDHAPAFLPLGLGSREGAGRPRARWTAGQRFASRTVCAAQAPQGPAHGGEGLAHTIRGMGLDLSVVIPAYNEVHRLRPTLERVLSYLEGRGLDFEVVVVDDGSSDGTPRVAQDFLSRRVWLLELTTNRGKGAALRHGVVATRGRQVLLCDADLSTPIEELEKLEPHLGEAQVVLGSRGVEGSQIEHRQPLYRELMGKTFNLILRLIGFGGFRDTQCGFKLLDGEVARELFPELTVDRFAYDVELVVDAQRRGHRVVEVGVEWNDSPTSRVRPLRDSSRMLLDVLRLRLR
jgi:glycosyltransferase involved in cell wall biosynthesis